MVTSALSIGIYYTVPKPLQLSVIIPTCDRPSLLRSCLRGLEAARQALQPGQCEIIVSDDGHGRETMQMLGSEFPLIEWTAGPQRGPAANRNRGARQACGEWLVFIDDDCLPNVGLLRSYCDAIEARPQASVFEGRIISDREKRHPLEECPINDNGGNLWSCNFAIRADAFASLHGFEERFPHAAGEDADLCYRLRKANHCISFVADAFVVHPWRRRSWRAHLRQHRQMLNADLLRISLNPELVNHFTFWNVCKDVVRYYARSFIADVRKFGFSAFAYQPVFLLIQSLRAFGYARRRGCGVISSGVQMTDQRASAGKS